MSEGKLDINVHSEIRIQMKKVCKSELRVSSINNFRYEQQRFYRIVQEQKTMNQEKIILCRPHPLECYYK